MGNNLKGKNPKQINKNAPQAKKFIDNSGKEKSQQFGWFLFAAIAVTTVCYIPALFNNFINTWDDKAYIADNNLIRTFSFTNFKYIFSIFFLGNYHPLTIVSYCIEYHFFKLNPSIYHFTNIVLHLLNTLLVIMFIRLLTKQNMVALITALLFGIHPMHVESVAWISERKDVLYAFFFLASLYTYMRFIQQGKGKLKLYLIALLMFVLSLISKGQAVVLPLIFIIIDIFLNRKFTRSSILEKVPFFILAFVFGIVAIYAQKSGGALQDIKYYSVVYRIMFASYGMLLYLWKAIIPFNLSCYYPYPFRINGTHFPYIFYIAPFAALALFYVVFRLSKKYKDVLFGFLFFLINMILVLQFLPVGNAIIAERYTYLSYIGVFFITGRFAVSIAANKLKWKSYITYSLIFIGLLFSYLTIKRCIEWKDGVSLWTAAINSDKDNWKAYNNRGLSRAATGNKEGALEDYTKSMKLNPEHFEAVNNRGTIYSDMGNYKQAVLDFKQASMLQPDNAGVFLNLGNACGKLGDMDCAIESFTKVISLNPTSDDAYNLRGLAYFMSKKYDKAIADYSYAVKLNPNHHEAYNNRGVVYATLEKPQEAIKDFSTSFKLDTTFADALLNLAQANSSIGNIDNAISDFIMVKNLYKRQNNENGVRRATNGLQKLLKGGFQNLTKIKKNN